MTQSSLQQHDLFISYADADRAWVEGYLLQALAASGVGVHSEAAFALGAPRLAQFEQAVKNSRRTLLVLSPAFVADQVGSFVDLLAQSYGLQSAAWPVIPLLLHPVELPTRLAMLQSLDATDPASWEEVVERLCAELNAPIPTIPDAPPCPYPGMRPFTTEQSHAFFGRDAEIADAVDRLRRHPFLTVIGPSGSGKSSLVFAGVVPALHKSSLFGPGQWIVRTLRPGATPLSELGRSVDLEGASPVPAGARLLLIIDQFEETFALARDEAVAFQQALLKLMAVEGLFLLLTVRADVYPELMASPLWEAIQNRRLEVTPLGNAQLREAIVRPAQDVGVFVETALVDRLVADAAGEPGILPLVQECLVLLWEQVARRFLPLAAYETLTAHHGAAGVSGLQVAMARHADDVYAGLSAQGQALARRIFLRLIQFGEGRADTRRQQGVAELRASGDDPDLFDQTLAQLTRNRLLTASGDVEHSARRVDISHEALIAGWPRLQEWLGQRRAAEQVRRRLEEKAQEWVRLGQGEGGLLDEYELHEAQDWLTGEISRELGVDPALESLVAASQAALVQVRQERAEAVRSRQRSRLFAGGLAVAMATLALVGWFWWQARSSERTAVSAQATAEANATIAVTAKAEAVSQAQRADASAADALAAKAEVERLTRGIRADQLTANGLKVVDESPPLALLLTVEGLRTQSDMTQTVAITRIRYDFDRAATVTDTALVTAGGTVVGSAQTNMHELLNKIGGIPLPDHTNGARAVTFSPDGHWLATMSEFGEARLWDITAGEPRQIPIRVGNYAYVTDIAFSPNGRHLLTLEDGIRMWDLTAVDPSQAPTILAGSKSAAAPMVFSPDGHWLAAAFSDNTIRRWDMAATDPGATVVVLTGHDDIIRSVALSPDGRWLASGSRDGALRLWDMSAADPSAASRVLAIRGDDVMSMAFSPDGHWLAAATENPIVRLWDMTAAAPGAESIWLEGHAYDVWSVAFSPNGRWLATASDDHTVRLWNLTSANPAAGPSVLTGHRDSVELVGFSPDGHWLATASADKTARLWDMTAADPNAAPIVLTGHEARLLSLAFSPDGRWLATGSLDETARLWDVTAAHLGADPIVLAGTGPPVRSVAFSPDGHWLATAAGEDVARLWDMTATNHAPGSIPLAGHESLVVAVAFSPDGHWLATASSDNTARLWDMTAANHTDAAFVLKGHQGGIETMVFSPDGRWLATMAYDNSIHLWDLRSSDPSAKSVVLTGLESLLWPLTMTFSPDGRWLVAASDVYNARLWDLHTPSAAPTTLAGHKDPIAAVAFSPDGRWLATASEDATARLWDVNHPNAAPMVFKGHTGDLTSVVFSPDGRWLVTASEDNTTASEDNTARLWDLASADPPANGFVLAGHAHAVWSVAFSPDGRWLATASRDKTARLWDLSDPGAAPIILAGHAGGVRSVTFSPDGRWLATASDDGTTRLWSWRVPELIDLACRTAGRNLTAEEWTRTFGRTPYRRTCERWPAPFGVIQ